MKAVILCAGRGTRLRPLTERFPKPLVPIANRPLVAHLLQRLDEVDIRRVALVVNPGHSETFRMALAPFVPKGQSITYIQQEKPLGLADAVGRAKRFVGGAPFVVLLGDNLFTWSMAPLIQAFRGENMTALLLGMNVRDPRRFGVLTLSGSRVLDLQEKPDVPRSHIAIAGIYFFREAIFHEIGRLRPSARGELELTDAVRGLIERGGRVDAHMVPDWCADLGTAEGLLCAHRKLLGEHTRHSTGGVTLDEARIEPPVFIDPASTVVRSTILGPAVVGAGVRIENASVGPFCSVGDRASVVGSKISNSIVLPGTTVRNAPGALSGCIIGDGMCIAATSQLRREV